MPTVTNRMKEDWDQRARDDAWYWVSAVHGRRNQDIQGYYEAGRRQAVEMLALGLKHAGMVPAGKTLLEIGCGPGRLLPGFAEMGFSPIMGVDVSPEMIERGRLYCPTQNAQFYLTDGRSLNPVESESVDVCFSYSVFQHFPNMDIFWSYIDEIHRVLKPGGCFQVHFRGGYTLKRRVLRRLPPVLRQPVHAFYRTLSLKWVHGGSVSPNAIHDPGHEETWELGVAVPPQRLAGVLRSRGFADVTTVVDTTYSDRLRFWALGRKGP